LYRSNDIIASYILMLHRDSLRVFIAPSSTSLLHAICIRLSNDRFYLSVREGKSPMASRTKTSDPASKVRKVSSQKDASRNQSGDKTRIRIIEAAEELFADAGYEGASLRKIMANAGVSISLINYHFGNKEGLLRAIFQHKAAP